MLLALLVLVGCGPRGDAPLSEATITIVIPYRAGGGFDRTVRAFAPFFARELGDGVTILPENLPGAGGRRGATRVHRSTPDGTTLGIFNLPGFVLPEVLNEKVDYDLRRLSWVGQLESEHYVLLANATSPISSFAELRQAPEVTFVSTGYGSSSLAASQIAASVLLEGDRDPIFVAGYAGTADYLVGLIRGDGNVALAPVSSAIEYIQSGDLRPLAVAGRHSPFEEVPTFAALGFPELTPLGLQRSLAGPPGVEEGRLATLRAAFERAVADPAFVAAAEKAGMSLEPLGGPATAAAVVENFRFYEAFRANLGNPNAM